MSRRAQPTIEDEFDDDTDLPLPARSLPDPGSKGALVQAIDSDSDDDQSDTEVNISNPGPASPSQLPEGFAGSPQASRGTVTDLTPYKKWTCIYPIYIDAKRRYGTGSRRVARPKAVWWPLSKDIAEATTRLGLGTLHEVQKSHPSDWDNPGRVRVQWKRDGHFVNSRIKTKKQLLEAIAFYIQTVKPELIPKPPFSTDTVEEAESGNVSSKQAPPPKTRSKAKGKGKDKTAQQPPRKRLPHPPIPRPPLASSVSAYSPALPSGVLVETIKAGMNAAAAENAAAPAGSGKGKRKVVRVRG
ncbi:signal recognition particle, SRP19 subunit [Fomitiporia mediterranea MF3/22]|uniref:signal recognition particle, SRP19 subunit n=1 Tax=Fomitiporia mediterranea (strain MF3/22) TaxID=694068 RepID=UPI000440788A|nr:signal recognition particle, SRP19 subunit [Fomitiporia mediterranea MF3/22]EJD05435.1 signal recognition particle, SRP19 subunit [Fomitiporia mediterranea MF3/22]